MTRTTLLFLSLAALLSGCALPFRHTERAPEPAPDIARTEPKKEEDKATRVFDEATRQKELAKRFPGADTVDLVRLLQSTENSTGPCWTDASPAWEMKVDAHYRIAGGREATATSFKDLKDQGWLAIYRSPNGTGIERRAAFDAIDLTFTTEYACRCQTNASGPPEEQKVPLRVRLRWQGKGKMPEVSGAILKSGGTKEGLKISFAPGSLLTYEVPYGAPYPGGRTGKCGGAVTLYVLATPPML